MALLDVSDLLVDADFVDTFDVHRRSEVVGTNGRPSVSVEVFEAVAGVVTVASPNDLTRGDDYQVMTRSLSVVTQFRLRGEEKGYQPDIIMWRGDAFLVVHIDPYPQFGRGFVQVECTSMDRTDVSLLGAGDVLGAYKFNKPANAVFVNR